MHAVVAGGGIAALEALAGLRKLASERVELTLLAPVTTFSYRPLSTAVPFTLRERRTVALDVLAERVGARFVHDGLAQIDEPRKRLLTHDGDFIHYDAVVAAVGARHLRHSGAGEEWHRGAEAEGMLARVLRGLEDGSVRRVALVVPTVAGWPVDAYELALVAKLAADRGPGAEVIVVTAEASPLEAFGASVAAAVANELAEAGIELRTGTEVEQRRPREEAGRDAFSSVVARLARRRPSRGGRRVVLHMDDGSRLGVDEVITLPGLRGPAVPGLPHDEAGFLSVERDGRVVGSDVAYGAGDATALALKHSTLAASQATAAAEALAAAAGAEITPTPWSPALYGFLTVPPHFPAERGSPWLPNGEPVTHCLWWPPGHVSGRHLSALLAEADPGLRRGLEWHPHGVPVAVPVASSGQGALAGIHSPSEDAVRHDALTRRLLALHRAEREGERLGDELAHLPDEFDRHRAEVAQRLEAAGYLRTDSGARARSSSDC